MTRFLPLLVAIFLLAIPVAGQSPADYQVLKKELEMLRQQVATLRVELNQLKAQRSMATAPMVPPIAPVPQQPAGARPAPSAAPVPAQAVMPADNVVLNLSRAPIRGAESAKVTLVEVSDFECPFCARYSNNTSGQIVREFVQTGKIRYAFVQLPIASHRNAFKAAEASLCAGDQGKFWEMHDRLFQVAGQGGLVRARLPESATAVGLRADTFNSCLDSSRHAAAVQADIQMVQQYGVRGTPTFFLGTMDPKTKQFRASKRIVGSKAFAIFQETLNSMVSGS